MLKGLHTCKKKKGKKSMGANSKKKQTKQTKLRDQEDKARNAKSKQEDYFAKLADEAGDNDENDENDGIAEVMTAVEKELRRAVDLHGGMRSCHEGYAVILEEVDELWEHIRLKSNLRKKSEMRLEAIQIAAMAARFVVDLC
jgi:hypothetical protein